MQEQHVLIESQQEQINTLQKENELLKLMLYSMVHDKSYFGNKNEQ
ncbi:MAG: hypothetical protein ABIO32_09500 [Ferruginibacter sp.]